MAKNKIMNGLVKYNILISFLIISIFLLYMFKQRIGKTSTLTGNLHKCIIYYTSNNIQHKLYYFL